MHVTISTLTTIYSNKRFIWFYKKIRTERFGYVGTLLVFDAFSASLKSTPFVDPKKKRKNNKRLKHLFVYLLLLFLKPHKTPIVFYCQIL